MYKNKLPDGRNNICGKNIKKLRQQLPSKTSQRKLADLLQIRGLDIDKNAVQRMESGQRFVTDIELKVLSDVFHVSCDELLQYDCSKNENKSLQLPKDLIEKVQQLAKENEMSFDKVIIQCIEYALEHTENIT